MTHRIIKKDGSGTYEIEFILSDSSIHIEKLRIDKSDYSSLDQYLSDYQVAFEKGKKLEILEKAESSLINQTELEDAISNLKQIWGEYGSHNRAGHVSGFLHRIQMQDLFTTSIPLWQKKNIFFLNNLISELMKIEGFDVLERQLGTDSNYDDQLLATYFFNLLFGVSQVEQKNEFDADFVLGNHDSKCFVQVKSLKYNSYLRFEEQASIISCINKALQVLGKKDMGVDLEGFLPLCELEKIDWVNQLKSIDFSTPLVITGTNRSQIRITWLENSNRGSLSGIDSIFSWKKRVSEVAATVPNRINNSTYSCLLVVPTCTIKQLIPLKYQLFAEWQSLNIDSVIFFEYTHGTAGYSFKALEQSGRNGKLIQNYHESDITL